MDIKLNLSLEAVERAHPVDPPCVAPETTVRDVLHLLQQRRANAVLVCRDELLIGIFTERDVLRLLAHGADLDVSIESVMTPRPVALSAEATVADAVQKMSKGGYRHLPILDARQRPVGMVVAAGIVHYVVEHFPKTVYNQPPVAQAVTQHREGA